jgi:hypothetical protein
LDKVADANEELSDIDVREQMRDAIESALLSPVNGFELPNTYGMFDSTGDRRVKAALTKFVDLARLECESLGLKSRAERLQAFQNSDVESMEGNTYDEYFGHDPVYDN